MSGTSAGATKGWAGRRKKGGSKLSPRQKAQRKRAKGADHGFSASEVASVVQQNRQTFAGAAIVSSGRTGRQRTIFSSGTASVGTRVAKIQLAGLGMKVRGTGRRKRLAKAIREGRAG